MPGGMELETAFSHGKKTKLSLASEIRHRDLKKQKVIGKQRITLLFQWCCGIWKALLPGGRQTMRGTGL